MITKYRQSHSADNLFSLLLLGLFVIFLLIVLVFSADVYRVSVRGLEENNNLRTAETYITTKFRQHNERGSISPAQLGGGTALCLRDDIENETYYTYIYFMDGELRELFTPAEVSASPGMGTAIASLKRFEITETQEGFFRITMEDEQGAAADFLLSPVS